MKKLIFLLIILISCSKTTTDSSQLDTLAAYMLGSFSNESQVKDTYGYTIQNIVELWPENQNSKWLLEQQSLSINKEDVFRQRILKLSINQDGILSCDIYFTKEHHKKASIETLKALTPDSLDLREGCSLYFRKEGDTFLGATFGDQCELNYQNANHIIEQYEISKDLIKTWIIGYNSLSEPVWGSEETAYQFKRK